jgi:hypothetical protein
VIGASCLLFALAATTPGGAATPASAPPRATTVAGTEAFPRKDVPPLVKEVFATGFPFCTDEGYPLTRDELKWCDLLPKQDPRCPALERACHRGPTAELVSRSTPSDPVTITLPRSPLPLRMILWLLLGGLAAFVIYLIIKQALAQSAPTREEEAAVEIARDAPEDPRVALARQIETDVQRLIERAHAAAQAGDFAAAVADAYAALLRKLEGSGIVTVESHRTNGDHVRDVGRQVPGLRPRMQAVVSEVEEVQFGGAAPTFARFRAVMGGVVGLLAEKLAGWLPFAIKLAVGLALAGSFAGCSKPRYGWDHSPSGRAGVFDLLEKYGFKPHERLSALSKIDSSASALLLLPGANVDDAGWTAIGGWTAEGGTLIVAGGERVLPSWIGVTITANAGKGSMSAPLTIPPEQHERLPKLVAAVPAARQVQIAASVSKQEDGSEEAPPPPLLVRGKTIYAIERGYEGGGRAIVLADDRLLTNASLLVNDNARLLIELMRPGGPKIDVAGELTGLVSQNPVTSVQRSRLAPAMLQLLLLILLYFVYKGAHFGRPIDPIATTRRRFSEHARAIGMVYGRNRAGRHALEVYGSYALDRMRERLNLAGGKGLIAVAEEIATRTGRPLGEVLRVLVESRPVKRDVDPERERLLQEANAAKDLATMRDIATLLQTTSTGGAGERSRSQG